MFLLPPTPAEVYWDLFPEYHRFANHNISVFKKMKSSHVLATTMNLTSPDSEAVVPAWMAVLFFVRLLRLQQWTVDVVDEARRTISISVKIE